MRMPVLFLGHGSPMNAIETNDFTKSLNTLGARLEKPKAILCISAHWMTEGTWVTSMKTPRTIHDFYGFPQSLFDIQYPAPGSPEVASLVQKTVSEPQILADDHTWGLDHGTWSVLRHMYPEAQIPVLQMSVYLSQTAEYHLQVGEQLRKLRDEGVLIVGSGNIVHNLRTIRWEDNAQPFDWAIEFDEWVKKKVVEGDYKGLARYTDSKAGLLSVPSPDHYYPLLYVLGAAEKNDELKFEFEGIQNGSISMRCLSLSSH